MSKFAYTPPPEVDRRSSRDYHDLALEYGIKSPGMSGQSQQWRDRVDNVHSQAQRTGQVDAELVDDASKFVGRRPSGR